MAKLFCSLNPVQSVPYILVEVPCASTSRCMYFPIHTCTWSPSLTNDTELHALFCTVHFSFNVIISETFSPLHLKTSSFFIQLRSPQLYRLYHYWFNQFPVNGCLSYLQSWAVSEDAVMKKDVGMSFPTFASILLV